MLGTTFKWEYFLSIIKEVYLLTMRKLGNILWLNSHHMTLNTQQKPKQCAIVVLNSNASVPFSLSQRKNVKSFPLASGPTTLSVQLTTQATLLAPLAPKAAPLITLWVSNKNVISSSSNNILTTSQTTTPSTISTLSCISRAPISWPPRSSAWAYWLSLSMKMTISRISSIPSKSHG
jgi:hypothetical protein